MKMKIMYAPLHSLVIVDSQKAEIIDQWLNYTEVKFADGRRKKVRHEVVVNIVENTSSRETL